MKKLHGNVHETWDTRWDCILNALIRAKREDNKEISVFDVGGKPKQIIPGKTQSSIIGTENPTTCFRFQVSGLFPYTIR